MKGLGNAMPPSPSARAWRRVNRFLRMCGPLLPAEPEFVRHRVKRGETLEQIARRYGSSVDKIMQINGMRKSHLQAGTTILIPKV